MPNSNDTMGATIAFWLTLALVLLGVASSARAAEPDLLERARELGIARSIGWRRLVHYRPGLWGNLVSEVDGPHFFLAPDGKHDPDAELTATLEAFQAPVVPGREDEHALCRFPARRRLLDEELHFEERLRAPACPGLSRYEAQMATESVMVVYSANYLNNPASAFGHTFLRLKKRRAPGDARPADQVDFGIDYTANTDTANPFLYAFKGMTGLFPGVFRFHSYEFKVREYGNAEGRDLWEYDLALSPREVSLLMDHLWELGPTYIDYFYLTKNCSFQILDAIESVAPRINLIAGLNTVVLPKDTIKALFSVPGLVRAMHYRPSLRSQLRAHTSQMDAEEEDAAERLARDPNAALPHGFSPEEAARALDTAALVLDARFAKIAGGEHDPGYAASRALLVRRRRSVAAGIPETPIPMPRDKAPEQGHGSLRVDIGTGVTTQYEGAFGTLGYRLALHDLADPPDGEPELLQVQFLDTRLRYDLAQRSLTLDKLTFAELLALKPLTRFEKALSWRARGFGMRLHDRGCSDCFAHGLDGAVGATIATESEHLAFFAMADAYVAFSPSLDGIGGSFVRVGVGPYAGLRVRLPAKTVGLLTGTLSYLPGQSLSTTYDVRATLRSSLGKDVALGLEASIQPYSSEVALHSYFYF
ncbi:DUF4105 domain-containing protein [Pendulispora rubella]|uniref:DUF4105 domain-containing protein n=1 Tax=Pendulispora rubella TaxID=2741070 RepID=A0ABZ2KSY8_9BACT